MSFNPKQGEIRLALAEYLRQNASLDLDDRKDIQVVTGYADDTINSGYCETCWHEEAIVRVFYLTWDNEPREYVIVESFAYLISDLDEIVSKYGEIE